MSFHLIRTDGDGRAPPAWRWRELAARVAAIADAAPAEPSLRQGAIRTRPDRAELEAGHR
ncbi:hypothetical protein [Xanthomonas graminis]|uniref:hypothetical protein n=1 Tax=Xanthomonas graminis TaxID=3390026 RepID=UPI000A8495E5|nr:hypothetical protein [Xanthomonas translucens]UKE77054.1 hypothetical protein KM317_16725 [Xanthomonas translucens pv. arrhenatheri]